MPRGGWFGRGYGFFGRGRGFGNPYLFCRRFPWLPRWWWAYPRFSVPYYGGLWGMPYRGYWGASYAWPYPYPPYAAYY